MQDLCFVSVRTKLDKDGQIPLKNWRRNSSAIPVSFQRATPLFHQVLVRKIGFECWLLGVGCWCRIQFDSTSRENIATRTENVGSKCHCHFALHTAHALPTAALDHCSAKCWFLRLDTPWLANTEYSRSTHYTRFRQVADPQITEEITLFPFCPVTE